VFLKLGVTSFGGPIAHLGYYRNELVVRRRWIDEAGYADLVAMCQFLPGPASSQVGFSLGILRGNSLLGGLAAWFAFTMPSALIMFAFAMSATAFTGPIAEGFLHGLKLVAVAVVAQAIWGMSRTLTPDRARAGIALAAIAIVVFFAGSFGQIAAIVLGAGAGLWLCRGRSRAAGCRSFEFSGYAARGCRRAGPVRSASLDPAGRRQRDRLPGAGLVQRVLPVGSTGLWRRPCRIASAAGPSRYAGMGQ
jgi:putative chromate ion transporter